MFFLFRCAVCMGIVFYVMPWPHDSQTPNGAGRGADVFKLASEAAESLTASTATAVTAKLEESCLKAPADCAALAAKLPQIVAMANQTQTPHAAVSLPKWPLRLAESEPNWPILAHKAISQRN